MTTDQIRALISKAETGTKAERAQAQCELAAMAMDLAKRIVGQAEIEGKQA